MRNKTHYLALIICGLIFALNIADALAQSQTKDFGWSLKKFEKNQKPDKKDKKDKNSSQNQNQTNSPPATSAGSQNSNTTNTKTAPPDDETIRVETNLVINDILVVNEKGTAVPNLKSTDFIVSEDGAEQKVELFAYGENAKLPRSIVLITYPPHFLPYQSNKTLLSGAEVLIDKLTAQDKMAIVTGDLKLVLPFTKDKELLKKTLTNLPPKGGLSPLKDYGTLMAVLEEMFDEKDVRPIIIFQSGGGELILLKPDKDTQPMPDIGKKVMLENHGQSGYGFSDVIERIQKSRATIYSVVPSPRFTGLPREEQLRRARIEIAEWAGFTMKYHNPPTTIRGLQKKYESSTIDSALASEAAIMKVAKLSGGYTEFIERPEDASKVYSTILAVINNRYTIGYYPTNQAKDGNLRRIKIAVRGHPEYMILGRESYFAPGKER